MTTTSRPFLLAAAMARVASLSFVAACSSSHDDEMNVASNAAASGTGATGGSGGLGGSAATDDLGVAGTSANGETNGPYVLVGTGGSRTTDGMGGAAGSGGATSSSGGQGGDTGADAGGGGSPVTSCTGSTLPAIDDYGTRGPFETTTVSNTGPNGAYTMFRPTTLGENGFKHAPVTWGNGLNSTPSGYSALLGTIASHGFVVIASNNMSVNGQLLTAGLEWLIAQNDAAGDFEDNLATNCAVSIGYSFGGGAAVNAGSHPNVATTVSFHGLQGAAESLHGPLLLFTSTGDTFVSAAQFVTPTFNRSTVQTFYATLIGGGHLTPTGNAGAERAPAVAWLRLWTYGDEAARRYFEGKDCTLCVNPWTNPRQKNWP